MPLSQMSHHCNFSNIVNPLNLIHGDKFPAVFSVFGVEPDFSPVTKVLNKVFPTNFNKCQNNHFLYQYTTSMQIISVQHQKVSQSEALSW